MRYLLICLLFSACSGMPPPPPDCPVGLGCHTGTEAEIEFSIGAALRAGGNYDGYTFHIVQRTSTTTAGLDYHRCISGYVSQDQVVSTPAALAHEFIHLDIIGRGRGQQGTSHDEKTGWMPEDTLRLTRFETDISPYWPYETIFDCVDEKIAIEVNPIDDEVK